MVTGRPSFWFQLRCADLKGWGAMKKIGSNGPFPPSYPQLIIDLSYKPFKVLWLHLARKKKSAHGCIYKTFENIHPPSVLVPAKRGVSRTTFRLEDTHTHTDWQGESNTSHMMSRRVMNATLTGGVSFVCELGEQIIHWMKSLNSVFRVTTDVWEDVWSVRGHIHVVVKHFGYIIR